MAQYDHSTAALLSQFSKDLRILGYEVGKSAALNAATWAPSTNSRLSLVNFHDACGLDHRRAPLPFREAGSPLAVDVDARELLAVPVVDRYLPVTVFPAPVAPHAAGLAGTFRFRHSSSDGTAGLL
jgi:hypothetical protein